MSAYIVEMNVIRYLIDAADRAAKIETRNNPFSWFHQGQWHNLTEENAPQVGQILWDENRTSVLYLYADNPTATAAYSPSLHYIHLPAKTPLKLDHVQALKTVEHYNYQSNSHPDWDRSQARVFTTNLKNVLVRTLPGYDAAIWGAPPFQTAE